MKFAIEKTSDYYRKTKPHKDAFLDGVDRRGKNLWCIEVESLEQLIGIADSNVNANAIVIKYDCDTDLPVIEIYNTYRE